MKSVNYYYDDTILSTSRKNSPILLKLLLPETLLLLGVFQALFPYLIWAVSGVNENYSQEINGAPVLLWVIGFLSFWIGARLASMSPASKIIHAKIRPRRIQFILYLFFFIWSLLLFLVINAYGGIPILEFLKGSLAVDAVNDAQASSFPGLFGIWLLSNTMLIISVTLSVISRLSYKPILSTIIKISIVAVIFGAIMAGKRQSLLIAATIIIPSIIIGIKFYLTKEKFRALSRRITFLTFITFTFLIIAFGVIGQIRTGNDIEIDSRVQIFNYLEYPLINMEWQLSEFGLLNGAGNIIPLVAGLIPYKLVSGSEYGLDNTFAIYSFFYPEPGIGAGFFGPVHLAFGILGVVFFGAVTGFYSRKVFNLANSDPRWLVPYSCFVWPLVSAHSYSHLTSILFFILPFVLSVFLSRYVFVRVKQ
jgi:oligosaccharide repeat unit polymerase